MSLYLQHGYGKSTRITDAYADGSTSGVVFSPRNEKKDNLDAYIAQLRATGSFTLMMDPQFHICTQTPPKDSYLPKDYGYYQPGLTAHNFTKAAQIQGYAADTLDFQYAMDLDRILSPTVILSTFSDRWIQIAHQLAEASVAHHAGMSSPKPLMLSFVLCETALDSRTEVDQFLDELTTYDVDGFYICIVRDEATYTQHFDPDRLAHLMYATYVLGELNDFEVVFGYSDYLGLPLRAAGATAFASGWSQSLRQCHAGTFIKVDRMGRRPLFRYSSGPLLNTILLSELEQIHSFGRLNDVLSNVALDREIISASSPESSSWNERFSERHHWQTLADLDSTLGSNVRKNMVALRTRVAQAQSLYQDLESIGIRFSRNCDKSHLPEWEEAITEFVRIASP
ncbi:hypothetical protein [Rhodopirellula europaea]|uniref:hypothetical protein n=1 Tax=Rhodopirellula europaea TaxID=1263866 RepID=UPI003D2B2DA7